MCDAFAEESTCCTSVTLQPPARSIRVANLFQLWRGTGGTKDDDLVAWGRPLAAAASASATHTKILSIDSLASRSPRGGQSWAVKATPSASLMPQNERSLRRNPARQRSLARTATCSRLQCRGCRRVLSCLACPREGRFTSTTTNLRQTDDYKRALRMSDRCGIAPDVLLIPESGSSVVAEGNRAPLQINKRHAVLGPTRPTALTVAVTPFLQHSMFAPSTPSTTHACDSMHRNGPSRARSPHMLRRPPRIWKHDHQSDDSAQSWCAL